MACVMDLLPWVISMMVAGPAAKPDQSFETTRPSVSTVAVVPRQSFPWVLAFRGLARAVILHDQIFKPDRAVRTVDALRAQCVGPVAHLRLIEHIAAALRHDREEEIVAVRFEVKFAVHVLVDVQQPDAVGQFVGTLPNPVHVYGPGMTLHFRHLAGENVLGACKTLGRRD